METKTSSVKFYWIMNEKGFYFADLHTILLRMWDIGMVFKILSVPIALSPRERLRAMDTRYLIHDIRSISKCYQSRSCIP
jgi:hypothetical protein